MDNRQIWDTNWKQLGDYATNSAGSRWAFYLIRHALENVHLTPGAAVVDCGCGIGAKTALLAKLFPDNHVSGIDFSSQGIEAAKEYFKGYGNLEFYCADVHDISGMFHEGIEMISAFELLEHLEDWQEYLSTLCEISDKYVLISTPTGRMREYEKYIGHYRNFEKGELEDFMKEHGYRPVTVLYAGFPFWSPITRDVYNIVNMSKKRSDPDPGMAVSFNPILHAVTYFVYRFLCFRRIGDQFVGLFEKN